jgi:hypothetical protein
MKPNEIPASGDADRFRTTHSNVGLLSAQTQVPGSRTALPYLCKLCRIKERPVCRGNNGFAPLI